jgi:sulfotransferase family protein
VNLRTTNDSCGDTLERPLAPERLRYLIRTPFYGLRGARARILARLPAVSRPNRASIFIIGCGRSGTTLLGELFAAHPSVKYLYEPYHRWAAMEPTTDFLHLYSRGEHHCLLGATSVTKTAQRRFKRVMPVPAHLTFVEKSPINALRIGYLNAIAPGSYFVHIARDGIDVVQSIERVAAVTRRMVFRPPLNEWWGVGDAKWSALKQDGQASGYYPDEVSQLTTDAQRGAYEWMLTLHEVENWRERLGSRFVELRYQDLIEDPKTILEMVMKSVQLSCPRWWLEQAASKVASPRTPAGMTLILPEQMCAEFNNLQASFGFSGRAVAGRSQ